MRFSHSLAQPQNVECSSYHTNFPTVNSNQATLQPFYHVQTVLPRHMRLFSMLPHLIFYHLVIIPDLEVSYPCVSWFLTRVLSLA
jgi:hypothetical protein